MITKAFYRELSAAPLDSFELPPLPIKTSSDRHWISHALARGMRRRALSNSPLYPAQADLVTRCGEPAVAPGSRRIGSANYRAARFRDGVPDRVQARGVFGPSSKTLDSCRSPNLLDNALPFCRRKHFEKTQNREIENLRISTLKAGAGQKIRTDHFQTVATRLIGTQH